MAPACWPAGLGHGGEERGTRQGLAGCDDGTGITLVAPEGEVPHWRGSLAPVPRGSKLTMSNCWRMAGGNSSKHHRKDLVAALAGTARVEQQGARSVGRVEGGGPGHGQVMEPAPGAGSRAAPRRCRTGGWNRPGRPPDDGAGGAWPAARRRPVSECGRGATDRSTRWHPAAELPQPAGGRRQQHQAEPGARTASSDPAVPWAVNVAAVIEPEPGPGSGWPETGQLPADGNVAVT